MQAIKKFLLSSLGKKYFMAVTGLLIIGFLVTHLAANLTLLLPEGDVFNSYAHGLKKWGPLLTVAELGLGALFLIHAFMGIYLKMESRSARPSQYARSLKTKGGESKSGLASNYMVITGAVLLVFVTLHILQFRFGPGMDAGYIAEVEGHEMRDLYRLVVETFQEPIYVVLYMGVMGFLGFHLRHGFWSLFQSLGLAYPKWSKAIYALGLVVALIFAMGFFIIPIWLYFDLAGAII